MSDARLRLKFKQSKDYTHEMLIRDLIEYAQEVDKRISSLEQQGTWEPAIYFGATIAGTHTRQNGTWIRVKNFIHAQFDVQISAKGAGVGNMTLRGLPYNAIPNQGASAFITYMSAMALPADSIPSLLGHSGGLTKDLLGRYTTNVTSASLTDVHFTNTSRLIGSAVYITPDA